MELRDGEAGQALVPEACTLPTAERPARVAEFGEVLAEAVTGVERPDPARLRLILKASPRVAGRVAPLAAAETACCSFFTFVLTAASGGLTLDVTVPPAHAGVLDAMAEHAAALCGNRR